MELSGHIGIIPESDLTLATFILRIRATISVYFLLHATVVYQLISFGCFFLVYIFPESTNNIKRLSSACFWDLCLYFLNLNDVQFSISGDEIDSESAVIISNHQSLADYIAMAYLAKYSNANNRERSAYNMNNEFITLPRVNFFSWFILWRVPNIKIPLNLAKCDENWELDKKLSISLLSDVFKSKIPEWIILFPEVNIWTEEDSALQKRQSEKYYLPILNNTLYPRFSGFYNVISAYNSIHNFKFSKLYDVTIYYQDCSPGNFKAIQPSLFQIFASEKPITINIDIRSKTLSRVPTKRKKLEKWLENIWIDKDKHLKEAYSNLKENKIVLTQGNEKICKLLH